MPTTTTGLATSYIQFSRASNATVTDSSGFIEWAGHNLLTNSESFDASAWQASGTVIAAPTKVAANAVAAPNGTTTADEISFPAVTGAGNVSILSQSFTNMPLVQHTAAIWVKAKAAGDIGKQIVLYSWTGVMAIKTHVTLDGTWQYVSASGTWTQDNPNHAVGVIGSTYGGVNQGAVSVYLWGAHLYRSDLGGMVLNPARGDAYYPTTPPNLLGYTEDFSNAAWSRSNISAFGSGSVANAAVAPNGLQTADLLVPDTTSAAHTIFQTLTVGGLNVQALYVKPAGYTKIALRESQTGAYYASFNLVGAGSVLDSSGATAAITALSDGWYRISMIGTISGTTRWSMYFLSPSYTSGSVIGSWTPDGTSGIYLWGAQLSDSASLDTYSPVYGAAVTSAAYYAPRLDYDPSTLAAKGLLVEEQRTNLQLHSEALDNVFWTKFGATAAANNATAPSGTMTADTVTEDTSNGVHYLATGITLATNTSVAYSFYARRSSGTRNLRVTLFTTSSGLRAFVNFDTLSVTNQSYGSATYTSGAITSVGSGWYRVVIVGIPSPTEANPAVDFVFDNGTGVNYIGDGTSGFHMWGFQSEAGAFATSYIPTGAASATRSADVASVSTQAFPYSATEGSLVASFTPVNVAAARRAAQLDDATENERITLGTNSTPNGLMTVIDGGSSQASIATGTPAANTTMKLASRYKLNDFAVSANGAAVGTDTSGTLPTVTTLRLGSGTSSTEPLNGWLRQITYIPRALTNAELVARST